MMEEHDLPLRAARREFLVQPFQLLLVDVVAVEGEETDAVLWLEAVEPLAVHVERLVVLLDRRVIVVAERRVERDVGVEQRLIRRLELLPEVPRVLNAVDVVAGHDHEIVLEPGAPGDQLLANRFLRTAARTRITNHGELDGPLLVRKPQLLRRHRERQPRDQNGDEDRKSTRLNSSHSQITYAVFCL